MTSFMATPFMSRVLAASGNHSGNQLVDAPAHPTTLAHAVDQQMQLRAVVEQLVSEANSVLDGTAFELTDEVGTRNLVSRVAYRGIEVVLETRRTDDGRWISSADGGGHRRAELATTDQVEQLLLGLMTSSPKGTTCSTN